MFTDTFTVGTVPVTYTRRTNKGTRSVFVPAGDIPSNERRVEIAHEVTAAKRVNSLEKFAIMRPHPITGVLEEASVQIKVVRPASFTDAEMQLLRDHSVLFNTSTNFGKILNQEQ